MKKLIFILLSTLTYSFAFAQQSKVDSVITLLKKCKTAKGLDTLMLNSALQLISQTSLNDDNVEQLEKGIDRLKNRNDEDVCYYAKTYILMNLSTLFN